MGDATQEHAFEHRIPPQCGHGFVLPAGETLRVTSPMDEQVADLVAFARTDTREWLSTGRTIDYASSIFVTTGAVFYSNRSAPMLTMTADTAGRHDLLFMPCSPEMFAKQYGVTGHHPSCLENLSRALEPFGVTSDAIPTALNLFMCVDLDPESGRTTIRPPSSRAGDYVELRAEMDLVVGVSACSAETTNQGSFKPIDLRVG